LDTNSGIPVSRRNERPAELPALTSLRGLAALTVLLFHSSYLSYNFAQGALPTISRRGDLAVDLFFFLSGFVLAHVYGSRLAGEPSWRAVGKFIWARFCRIYPASFFATAVFVLAFTVGRLPFPADVSFKAQLIAALLLQQVPWLDNVVINRPSWSISAEWFSYMLFPLIVPMISRLGSRTAIAVGLALLAAAGVDHATVGDKDQASGWGALLRTVPEFWAGVFAYRCYSERLFRAIWEKDATFVAVTAMIAAACLADASDGPIVVLLMALLLASVCNSGRITGILNARPLRWLGEISYSVYIFQALPLTLAVAASGLLVAHGLGGAWFTIIAASFALGCGVLVHRCVDLPARAALRRLPGRVAGIVAACRGAKANALSLVPISSPERDR
jgi:peptidoglycan/LPS O-acetylase OafA/YrhL